MRFQHTLFAVLGLGGFITPCRPTLAQEGPAPRASRPAAECAHAYEAGQELRSSGQLISARNTLQSCAQESCPGFIRTDCATWLVEIQNELPTVVVAAHSQGRAVAQVHIIVDGRELSSGLDGQALELDPGQYDFEFQAAGMQPLEQRLIIARGERNRLIQIDLEPLMNELESSRPLEQPEQVPREREQVPHEREQLPTRVPRSLVVPGVFAGAGVAGLAGFVGFGAWGHSSESRLKKTCSPNCGADSVSAVRTKYLVADVSLGMGIASLVLGTYFFFDQSSAPRAHVRSPRLAISPRHGGGTLLYGGEFE
jgi:hypothetical protein